jgi:hypothetical protein
VKASARLYCQHIDRDGEANCKIADGSEFGGDSVVADARDLAITY